MKARAVALAIPLAVAPLVVTELAADPHCSAVLPCMVERGLPPPWSPDAPEQLRKGKPLITATSSAFGGLPDMSLRVTYSTDAFAHKNGGKVGSQTERDFASVDEAKAAKFPEGHTFALLNVDTGYHVYHSDKFGWEFVEKPLS
jgi:hypothetical protein